MPVAPPPPRYSVEELENSVRFVIPSRKYWFSLSILGLWALIAIAAELAILGTVIASLATYLANVAAGTALFPPPESNTLDAAFPIAFGLVWVAGWTYGVCFVLYKLLWGLTGKEVMEVSRQSITLSRRILGFSRPKEYLAEHINDLRAVPCAGSIWPGAAWSGFWTSRLYTLAFDYGARTFRFGAEAEEAEAKQILAEVLRRFPGQYGLTNSQQP